MSLPTHYTLRLGPPIIFDRVLNQMSEFSVRSGSRGTRESALSIVVPGVRYAPQWTVTLNPPNTWVAEEVMNQVGEEIPDIKFKEGSRSRQ